MWNVLHIHGHFEGQHARKASFDAALRPNLAYVLVPRADDEISSVPTPFSDLSDDKRIDEQVLRQAYHHPLLILVMINALMGNSDYWLFESEFCFVSSCAVLASLLVRIRASVFCVSYYRARRELGARVEVSACAFSS